MGSFIGHAATGSVFWIGGLFFLIRAMGLRMCENLRWSSTWLQLPGYTNIIGGIIYSIGEWYRTGTYTMMNLQHYLMASTFIISGAVQLLHMHGVLRGIAWCLISPINWFILGLLFNFHPQADLKAEFGHLAMGWLFGFVTLLESAQFLMGYYVTNPRTPAPNESIQPMYKNPMVYGTPIPTLIGVTLMIIGFIDWDMAVDFAKPGEIQGTRMDMEMNVVIHTFVNLVIAIVVTVILTKLDEKFCCNWAGPTTEAQWISNDTQVWQVHHHVPYEQSHELVELSCNHRPQHPAMKDTLLELDEKSRFLMSS